jgi:hypothetical protein
MKVYLTLVNLVPAKKQVILTKKKEFENLISHFVVYLQQKYG